MKIDVTPQQAEHLRRLLETDRRVYAACNAEYPSRLCAGRVAMSDRLLAKIQPAKSVKASKAQRRLMRLRKR